MGKEAVITGENIKEKRFVADEKNEKSIWLIELHAPRINRYTLSVSLEQKYHEVLSGEKRTIVVLSGAGHSMSSMKRDTFR